MVTLRLATEMLTTLIFCALTALMIVVMSYDVVRFRIPNWLVGLVLLLYPLHYFTSPVAINGQEALLVASVLLAAGFAVFAAGIAGAGDAKLLAACGLWIGGNAILEYLIAMSLLGGALSLALLIGRPMMGYLWLRLCPTRPLPGILEKGAPIPYGLAIAGAFLVLLLQNKIPGVKL